MKNWILESTQLLPKWERVATEKALIHMEQDGEKDVGEILMGYALAQNMLDSVYTHFVYSKETLNDEYKERFALAIRLARRSIPSNHPLLYVFLNTASQIDEELNDEVAQLKQRFQIDA